MNYIIFILSTVLIVVNIVNSVPQFYGPPRFGYGGYGGYGPRWGHHYHHMPPPPPPMMGPPPIVRTTVVKTITTFG
uniref:Uncharacterized protein n=1 Tax=Strongyloides papillosus TaxID=174720 RepID=A0A0N5C911_STREA